MLALGWSDINFEQLTMRVTHAVVHGRLKVVKTEYSEDELPLDPDFATLLLDWQRNQPRHAPEDVPTRLSGLSLLFPSHVTARHYHAAPVQQDFIRPAGPVWWLAPSAELRPVSGAWRTRLPRTLGCSR